MITSRRGLLLALLAWAPARAGDADRLGALQSENAILQWELKNAKLREQLQALRGASTQRPDADVRAAAQWRLLDVGGVDGALSAELSVGGGRDRVWVGSRLPGGWVVRSITAEQVELGRGAERRQLRF